MFARGSGDVDWVPRLQPRGLPDSALDPVPVLLGRERLAEAPAIAVVGDPGVDAEHERGLAGERCGQVNFDRGPAVAMNSDRRLVDEDHQLVEDPSRMRTMLLSAQSAGIWTLRR